MFLIQASARSHRGMTLIDTCAALAVCVVALVLVVPVLASSRDRAMQMSSAAQLRAQHMGMVVFAQDNNSWFPGLDAKGAIVPAGDIPFSDHSGAMPTARFMLLLEGMYTTPEYLLSPVDHDKTEYPLGTGRPITSDHISFAMLALDLNNDGQTDGPKADELPKDRAITAKDHFFNRTREWSETLNIDVPVITDRNLGSSEQPSSLWSNEGSPGWRGGVAYNDNHVTFEPDPVVKTRVATRKQDHIQDHLFKADTDNARDDAAMVFQDASSLSEQK